MTSSADTVGFAFLDARVRAAVQRAAVGDPDPTDPLRGLYISDEQALSLAGGERVVAGDERLAAAGARPRARPRHTPRPAPGAEGGLCRCPPRQLSRRRDRRHRLS